MTRTIDVEVVVDAGAELGESPLWDSAARQLVWVDIIPGVIHRLDVDSGRDERVHELGPTVGAVGARHDGGFVLARNNGFALLDEDGTLTEIGVDGDWSGKRMNDGKCDPTGRFWAGSIVMAKNAPDGALYRLDADLTAKQVLGGLTVSNGLGWSPDATTMYYIDSLAGGVDAYRFDASNGGLSNRRQLVDVPFEHGEPDGLTVDSSGCVWFAIWRAGEVRRYTPDGRLDTIVRVPASLSTSCCFGGSDLDTLFVTSARCDLTPDQRAAEPLAGAVFACRPGIDGLPASVFAGP